MRIAVVALGKIGLPLAVQYAEKGHEVIGVDVNPLPEFGAEVPERYVQHPGLVGVRALLDDLLGGRDLRAYRFDISPRLADVPGLGRFHAHGDGLGQI